MGYLDTSIGRGNIWTFFIGVGFTIWGAIAWAYPGVTGTPYLLIPGGIMIIVAISSVASFRYNREKIIGALRSYKRVSLKLLAKEIGMKEKEVKEIIVDLRTDNKIKASFEPETGDVIVLSVKGQAPAGGVLVPNKDEVVAPKPIGEPVMVSESSIKDQGYCPYCGSRIQGSDQFCVTCGSALE
ncbi:MAG: PCI domain-containing protein [Candidatus Heimdallarchaeota archaeon]